MIGLAIFSFFNLNNYILEIDEIQYTGTGIFRKFENQNSINTDNNIKIIYL